MQRALMQYRLPKNYELVYEALKKAGREDLIGFGPKCLIRPRDGRAWQENAWRENAWRKNASKGDGGIEAAGRGNHGRKSSGEWEAAGKTGMGKKSAAQPARKKSTIRNVHKSPKGKG